jgi:hypothetical protein
MLLLDVGQGAILVMEVCAMASKSTESQAQKLVEASLDLGLLLLGIGLGGLMQGPSFWLFVVFVYIGIACTAVGLYYKLRRRPSNRKLQWAVALSALLLLSLFTWFFVIVPAPLTPDVYISWEEHAPGSTVGPIEKWIYQGAELRVNFTNPSDTDYESVDLTISTDEIIFGMGKVSGSSSCSFTPQLTSFQREIEHRLPGSYTNGLWSSPIYRVTCDKLPRKSDLNLIAAIYRYLPDQGGHYNPIAPMSPPAWVEINAQYRTGTRPRAATIRIAPVRILRPAPLD